MRVICFGRNSCFSLAPSFGWHSKGSRQKERMTNTAACSPQSCSSCGSLHHRRCEKGRASRVHNRQFSQQNCTCLHQRWLGGLDFSLPQSWASHSTHAESLPWPRSRDIWVTLVLLNTITVTTMIMMMMMSCRSKSLFHRNQKCDLSLIRWL